MSAESPAISDLFGKFNYISSGAARAGNIVKLVGGQSLWLAKEDGHKVVIQKAPRLDGTITLHT